MAIDWKEKGEDDLEELLRRLKPSFDAILRRFRIPPQDAPDRIQNVLLHYLYKRSQVRNPAAWLRGALRRECLMYLRTCRRSRTVAVDEAIIEIIGPSWVPDPANADLHRRLRKWIGKMSYKCRKLLILRYFEDLDTEQTAKRTGFKKSSVDKVTRRCVQALARKIASAVSAISRRGKRRKKGDDS